MAHAFWERGANLVLVGRHAADLDNVIVSLEARTGQKATALPADFADPAAAAELVSGLRTKFPKLDALINNAAIQGPIGPLWVNDWGEWLATLQVDLLSPVALCKGVAPWMIEQGGGSIINISGGGATGPRPNFTAYAAAKCALVRFSETLAEELRPHNVRVNCVAPGAMNTSMLAEIVSQGVRAAGQKEYTQAVKARRDGGTAMERAAALCVFLASGAAKDITGKLISAIWDPWPSLPEHLDDLRSSDIYTLRRIVPKDRGKTWGGDQ